MATYPVAIKPKRAMGSFVADAVIEEQHNDESTVTRHPVEQGSTISDHAYAEPAELTLTYAWSPSGSQNTTKDPNFLNTLYANALLLKANRTLVTVYTGKRTYKNMLLQGIGETTDRTTENVLMLRLTLVEILLALTTTITQADPANQAFPSTTSNPANQGFLGLLPAPHVNLPSLPGGLF